MNRAFCLASLQMKNVAFGKYMKKEGSNISQSLTRRKIYGCLPNVGMLTTPLFSSRGELGGGLEVLLPTLPATKGLLALAEAEADAEDRHDLDCQDFGRKEAMPLCSFSLDPAIKSEMFGTSIVKAGLQYPYLEKEQM